MLPSLILLSMLCSPQLTLSLSTIDVSYHSAVSELLKIRPRTRLKEHHKHLFKPKRSLLDDLGLIVCDSGVVHRKEFLETYAAATAIHDANFLNDDDTLVADLAAGHGLLGWFLLMLAKDSGLKGRRVICVDLRKPPSADKISKVMRKNLVDERRWSYTYLEVPLTAIKPNRKSLLASVHACGTLSDVLIEMAIQNGAPLALVPCCHTIDESMGYQPHQLSGMTLEKVRGLVHEEKKRQQRYISNNVRLDNEAILADIVDRVRYNTLQKAGYLVSEVMLPEKFTPRNRLFLAEPTETTKLCITNNNSQQSLSKSTIDTRRMPPLISLADSPEEIMRFAALQNRRKKMSNVTQQTPRLRPPKYFSLHLAVWLPATTNSNDDEINRILSIETLQCLVDQICNERGMVCAVETNGDAIPGTDNRQSQLYRFQYKYQSKRYDDVSRAAAKEVHGILRDKIITIFGDEVLR